ncbi:MAG: isoprenylcysteine carboxylmethyltransferase family protein [Pseudorhodoplanes sp.]|nr:isoprenylcysteine carboxylmethyltransferase family protein [Pseudorhodoplanes sp.]
MARPVRDNPGVICPPPLIPLAALAGGLVLDWLVPAHLLQILFGLPTRLVAGGVLVVAGFALMLAGSRAFAAARTNIPPWKPALALVTEGVYAYVRNPMYVGFGFVTAGLALALASDWTLALMVPAAIVLHRGVVLREERYLEGKFGAPYRAYKAAVPRYGWPG